MQKDEESGTTNGHSNGATITPSSSPAKKLELHSAFYVSIWIFFSGSVILFNKWVLDTAGFRFPIFLTTWHLVFATIMTQTLARTTSLLDGLKTVKMDGRTYLRAIVPIGVFFSLSLIFSNQAYLYLSVAFIQMIKATTPVAVLLTSWGMQVEKPNLKVLGNVSVIVVGIIIASYGEIAFVLIGVIFQLCGIVFESVRLVMVQKLLSSAEYKMDPLVSLYYFAPVCAVMNGVCCLIFEGPRLSIQAILDAGLVMLFMNAAVAFCLNVAVVFLIGKTSSLVLTLCGVLKDILLVVLSVIIWSTQVTALQMFGYTIALGGLIWYKIGLEQAQAAYIKLTADENSTFNRFRRSLWAKIGAGVLVVFVVLAMAHGFTRGGIDTAATKTGLTGVPEPEMVDAYSGEGVRTDDTVGGWDDSGSSGMHYASDIVPTHPLDVVIYVPSTSSENTTLDTFQHVLSLPMISALNPHVIVYADSHISTIQVSQFVPLGQIRSASAAYLHYIRGHYDMLAEQTMFLHTDVDAQQVMSTVESRYSPRTGVVELSQGGYGVCACVECVDVFQQQRTHLSKVDELYALTNENICSTTEQLLLSEDALFLASANRIRSNVKAVYSHLLSALEATGPDSDLSQSIAKSWLYMLGCNDISMASRCHGVNARAEDCQCMD